MAKDLTDLDRTEGLGTLALLADIEARDPEHLNEEIWPWRSKYHGQGGAYPRTFVRDFVARFMERPYFATKLIKEWMDVGAIDGPFVTSRGGKSIEIVLLVLNRIKEVQEEVDERERARYR